MNTELDGARAYSYDEHDRLATETFDYTDQEMTDIAATYHYDDAGNHVTTGPDTFHGHSWSPDAYDRSNQFTDANNFGYNHEGDPSLYKGQTLTFDAEHHLTGYGTALTAAALVDGKRAWKQVGNARTFFCYDGDTLIGQQTGTNAQDFVPILSGPGGLIAYGDTGYQFDPEGNVVHRTDADGELVTTSVYDAWGVATDVLPNGDPATVSDPFGYKGQAGYYTDHETGLILCTHRYYDPELGRWLTRDPIGYDGGVNLFGYCGEEPVNGVDPSGFDALGWVLIRQYVFGYGKPFIKHDDYEWSNYLMKNHFIRDECGSRIINWERQVKPGETKHFVATWDTAIKYKGESQQDAYYLLNIVTLSSSGTISRDFKGNLTVSMTYSLFDIADLHGKKFTQDFWANIGGGIIRLVSGFTVRPQQYTIWITWTDISNYQANTGGGFTPVNGWLSQDWWNKETCLPPAIPVDHTMSRPDYYVPKDWPDNVWDRFGQPTGHP